MIEDVILIAHIKEFIFEHFSLDPDQVSVSRIQKPKAYPWFWWPSFHPLFWVKDDKKNLICVIKFYASGDFRYKGLFLSTRIFRSLNLSQSQCANMMGFTRKYIDNEAFDIVAISPAPGKGIHELLKNTRLALKAIDRWAKALAELHLAKCSLSTVLYKNDSKNQQMARFLTCMNEFPELFPFCQSDVRKAVEKLTDFFFNTPSDGVYVGILHGDPDPTHFFYEESTGMITMIDLDGLVNSLNANGNPVGLISGEYIRAQLQLRKTAMIQSLSEKAMDQLQECFYESYSHEMRDKFPSEVQMDCDKIFYFGNISYLLTRSKYFEKSQQYRDYLICELEKTIRKVLHNEDFKS